MKRSVRILVVLTTMVLAMTSVLAVDVTSVFASGTGGTNCGVRRTTGNGGTKHFCKGERVNGEVITLQNGRTYYHCYMAKAPEAGQVNSGVIRYFHAERTGPACSQTQSSPGPRNPTGDGKWGTFSSNDYVLGFAIEINMGAYGRTYFNCLFQPAGASGRVLSGVVNPSRFEMSGKTHCGNTQNWNPGFRQASGDGGTLRFHAGDRILAAYIRYDNGVERFNCYDRVADMDGSLTSGVVNYWPNEDNHLGIC